MFYYFSEEMKEPLGWALGNNYVDTPGKQKQPKKKELWSRMVFITKLQNTSKNNVYVCLGVI